MARRFFQLRIAVALLVIVGLSGGCASIQATRYERLKDSTLTEADGGHGREKGFEFFRAIPYILVCSTGDKEKPLVSQIVYLPDFDHVTIVNYKSGLLNSTEMGFTVEGGILKGFNQKQTSDTTPLLGSLGPIAEALGAVGAAQSTEEGVKATAGASLFSSIMTAFGTIAPVLFLAGPADRAEAGTTFDSYIAALKDDQKPMWLEKKPDEIRDLWASLDVVQNLLAEFAQNLESSSSSGNLKDLAKSMIDLKGQLQYLDTANPASVLLFRSNTKRVANRFSEIVETDISPSVNTDDLKDRIKKSFRLIDSVLVKLIGTEKDPDFQLYRYVQKPGEAPKLEQVWPPK